MNIDADQIRAARALKNWSQSELAERTGLAVPTIANIEAGKQEPSARTLIKIVHIFAGAGIEFIGSRGVRESRTDVQHYYDKEGFIVFLNDLYKVAETEGGEICLFNARPENWLKWVGDFWENTHAPRMEKIKDKFTYKLTSREGDTNFISSAFGEYRWMPEHLFNEEAAFYVYGDSVAFINFEESSVTITAIHQRQVTKAMRVLFNSAWDHLTIIPSK